MDSFKINKKKLILLILGPLGFFFFWSTAHYPEFIESYYVVLAKEFIRYLSLLTGLVPFSVAEVIFVLFPISVVILALKQRSDKGFGSYLVNLLLLLGVLYFCFVMIWGLNYNRQPFAEISGLKVEAAAEQELEELCINLINQANKFRQDIVEDEYGVMTINGGFSKVREEAALGYEKATEIYPELSGRFAAVKPIYFSEKMSYTGISGIFFPFTGEANVNIDIPHILLPATTCHEMAHQRGFAREDEANYIAWVTSNSNDNPEFKYSGTILALIHSMNAFFQSNPEKASELLNSYDEGVSRDLQNLSEYWKKHEGRVEEITSDVNDAYLKSNRQEDGVRSYGRMVDLLLAEQKTDSSKRFLNR